jgi:hypothetical protein
MANCFDQAQCLEALGLNQPSSKIVEKELYYPNGKLAMVAFQCLHTLMHLHCYLPVPPMNKAAPVSENFEVLPGRAL